MNIISFVFKRKSHSDITEIPARRLDSSDPTESPARHGLSHRQSSRRRISFIFPAVLLAVLITAAGYGSGVAQKDSAASDSSKPQSVATGTQATAESLVLVTDRLDIDFSKHIVTFIELGADKCIPCKAMQPIMKEVAAEYAGQVQVVFYDVWKNPEPGRKYNIQLIPTQVFIDKTGREIFRHMGLFPKEELVAFLKKQGVR